MPPQGAFPPQLVNLVIDELGDAYRRSHNYPTITNRRSGEYGALYACALVSKKWTIRSRAHLFRKVRVEVRESQPTLTPPTSILPCVKKLEIWCGYHPTQVASTADLLKVFSTSPIERLQIAGAELADKRVCIQECIHAHSATLRTIKFGDCSLSAPIIGDIVLGPNGLKRLHLNDCKLSSGHPLIADTQNPGACLKAAELEFCISADNSSLEGPPMIAAEIARLPYRFSRLNIAHFPTEEWDEAMTATSTLIKANADVLSSLQIRIFAEDMEIEIEPQHLPSLESCSNLSEVALNMEYSESDALRDTIFILSTLDPTRSSRLKKITLEARYVSRWFEKDGKAYDEEDWEGLDTLLSKLAKASLSTRERRLTFTLVATKWSGTKELMSTARKWLPKLLPSFNELGLLHVHYVQSGCHRVVDDGCLRHDKPDCLREDFKDSS